MKALGSVIVALLLLAVGAAAGGIVLLVQQTGWELELAKWLLTLAVGLLTAGAIAGVYKVMDARQERSTGWRDKLSAVTQAHDRVQRARMRMIAHKSARSYSLEMENLVEARELLRRTFHEGEGDVETRTPAKMMWRYLEELGLEYQAQYFKVSRYQSADHAVFEAKVKQYVGGDADALDGEYFDAPRAYRMIERFEKYSALVDPEQFAGSDFMKGYEELRRVLRQRLGVGLGRGTGG